MNLSQVKDFYSVCRNETRNPQPGTSTYYVGLYWFPVIFVIGALGNSLNLIVLNSKGMKSKTNIFLSAMAATDLCFFFVMFFNNLSVFDPLATSQDFMRIYFKAKMTFVVLANWFSMASIWIAIAVTVERLVAIRRPLHARLYWNSRRITLILIFIYIITFYLSSYSWFWMWPISLPRCGGGWVYGLQMLKSEDSPKLYDYVVVLQYTAIVCALIGPVIVLTFLNSWLVHSLRQSRREMKAKLLSTEGRVQKSRSPKEKKKANTLSSSQIVRHKTSENKVTFMVFVISALFVIFFLPSALTYIWETLFFVILRQKRPHWFPLAAYFSNQLVTFNKAINFIVYCGAGQHFRRKFVKLICKRVPFKHFCYGSRKVNRFNSTAAADHLSAETVDSIRGSPARSQNGHQERRNLSHHTPTFRKYSPLSIGTSV